MKKVLIVNSHYYKEITNNLVIAAKNILKRNKLSVSIINAPGIFEIPYTIRKNINKFDAFIAIGCVIKGQTPHFDLICKTVFDAILHISIKHNKPITNGIITALNKKQALERSGNIKANKTNRGLEASKAIISVLKNGTKKI
tara:strand:+ start:1378 stop:1803 length:426 start_codon:yes stop_codon:yes gene_type:complete